MVNQSQDPLPPQVGVTDNELDQHEPGTPTTRRCEDPPWIIRRVQKSIVEPPLTQPSRRGLLSMSFPPPPRLPKGLVHTPKPAGGFPVIHLLTPPWFNLLPEQRDRFDSYPEQKVWVRDWQVSKEADLMATSNKLKDLIMRMTGEKARLSTPQQEKEISSRQRNKKQKPPYHFLVSNISVRAHSILLAHPIMLTPEASAFFLPYTPPLLSFLCTIEGFTLSIRNAEAIIDLEDIATGIVCKTLTEDETIVTLLKGRIIGDAMSQHNTEPAKSIIQKLMVKLARGESEVERSAGSRPRKPLWNIFFKRPPPITWTSYFIFLQHIRNTKFVDMDCGSVTLVDEESRMHCFNCKGANHNPKHCEYKALKGWFGNAAAPQIEETAEFASSSRNKRYTHYGNRNNR
ncbi:hypothetical protein C0992_010861 [Termitomyces sp. T32_za158]|nr:hypothetical protein C0992_010861 [Termitomyces sp. T32_za158]